jgi:MFS family permease
VLTGFYYAASPNLLIDAVPADRQGSSAGMLAAFGGLGSALATALITPILTSHPFQDPLLALRRTAGADC